ncbi:hypothetical protein [Streptomyces gilvosporeus]|uniref:Uncharacterized protein n=1 Tax=Streptomyces gilvosporeus TaxID=553510 RepID=A0A1V0U2T3_9ACTN|nr:hypothetical protein [Streptomyces gilvosporeus]ARF59360.1 hypothetical protein B1H19_11210 [Streptomyces gilvosporeus]
MTVPPTQTPKPSDPRRHPYGSIRLPAPLAAPVAKRPAGPRLRRWCDPRVALPPLSIAALRRDL